MTKRNRQKDKNAISSKYTQRQYFNKLVKDGYSADYASALVNAAFPRATQRDQVRGESL